MKRIAILAGLLVVVLGASEALSQQRTRDGLSASDLEAIAQRLEREAEARRAPQQKGPKLRGQKIVTGPAKPPATVTVLTEDAPRVPETGGPAAPRPGEIAGAAPQATAPGGGAAAFGEAAPYPDAPRQTAIPLVERAEDRMAFEVLFDFDSAFIRPESRRELSVMCDFLANGDPSRRFYVVGHTDSSGAADYNLRLSLQRARAVRGHLTETCGVDPDRLILIGAGEQAPRPDAPPDHELQRRVELQILTS